MYRNVRQAVIMVGGMGTRLRPLTNTRPKPILPVADKPCLGYLIDSFVRGGIEEIYLACGYRSKQLMDAIGDGSDRGIVIRYSFEETPLGTGGAIKLLEDVLDDVFVAANGDVFADLDLKKEIDVHLDNSADITLALTPVDNPWEFGTAVQDGTGRIVRFMEKPRKEDVISNMINAGIYVVNKEMISYIPKNEPYDFSKDLVPKKTDEGSRIWGHHLDGIWMDVGRRSDLIRANMTVASGTDRGPMKFVTETNISGTLYLGNNASVTGSDVADAVVMKGAAVVNSKIRNSVIMPGTIVDGATVIDSVIGENTVVRRGAVIRNSLVGDGEIVASNTVVENREGA
ncbi:MAG: sugar phosphate nucleotidyltransferase [Candidatus Methanomethylophilaceae archaeon]